MNLDFIKQIDKDNVLSYFPEIKPLRDTFENNICHNNEAVLNHTIQVFLNCKEIIGTINNGYFETKIDGISKYNLFLLGALFHDIGKISTITKKNNITYCKNHEHESSILFETYFSNKLTVNQLVYIKDLIDYHTLIQITLDNKDQFEEKFKSLKEKYTEFIVEFTILGLADIYKGDLKINNLDEYNYRVDALFDKLKIRIEP